MKVNESKSNSKYLIFFGLGWSLVLLSIWFSTFSYLQVFLLPWKVELAASLFLIFTLLFLLYTYFSVDLKISLSHTEIRYLVVPITLFIIWSSLSAFWGYSWKAAAYHTLIWLEYLVFYLIVRHVVSIKDGFKTLIKFTTFVFVLMALPAIIEYCAFIIYAGSTTLGIRFAKYGEQVVTLIPLVFVITLRHDGKKFALGASAVTIFWLFVLSTLSRTSLLLCLAGISATVLLVFALRQFHRYRRKTITIILIAAFSTFLIHSLSFLAEKPNVPIIARVSDNEGISYSNNFRKLMTLISLEIFKTHPFVGIGADNYGIAFNEYRAIYADKNPTDINLKVSENEIAERSHNEYLQILAELGIVGGIIFMFFLGSVGIMSFLAVRHYRQFSLIPLAALIGAILFLISSLVSSYSFRLMQNGLIFFFVLAVAAKYLLRDNPGFRKIIIPSSYFKAACCAGITACLLLGVYCSMRAASVYYARKVVELTDLEQAMPLYEKSFSLDELNPDAHFDLGINLLNAGRYDEAAHQFRQSIDIGRASSGSYSYLSTAQYLAGDTTAAEKTFAEALKLYPLSPFVRTRYAYFLQLNGKKSDAEVQLDKAQKLDRKQANSWWSLINEGIALTTEKAFKNKDEFAPVMDLVPGDSLAAVRAEREMRFPSEKIRYNSGK